ncbi:unnamed protein product [Coffea canephora]|nr:unnamed protein product [Coffea canephora]
MDLFEDADRLRNDDGSTLLKYVQRVIKIDTSISMLLMFTLRGAVSFIFRQTMIKLKAFEVQFPTWFPASIRCPAFECLLWTGRLLTSNRTQMRCFVFEIFKMMQIETKSETHSSRLKMGSSPPPPPPVPPLPKFSCTANPAIKRPTVVSVTNQEIAMYWRQRSMVEEDHLLAAIKAAARIRARNLSEDDYRRFEESLKEDDDGKEKDTAAESFSQKDEKIKELRVGIKDWWTKSKYAYLNQPVIESMDTPKRRASAYIPQFCCYMSAPPPATRNLGIF